MRIGERTKPNWERHSPISGLQNKCLLAEEGETRWSSATKLNNRDGGGSPAGWGTEGIRFRARILGVRATLQAIGAQARHCGEKGGGGVYSWDTGV